MASDHIYRLNRKVQYMLNGHIFQQGDLQVRVGSLSVGYPKFLIVQVFYTPSVFLKDGHVINEQVKQRDQRIQQDLDELSRQSNRGTNKQAEIEKCKQLQRMSHQAKVEEIIFKSHQSQVDELVRYSLCISPNKLHEKRQQTRPPNEHQQMVKSQALAANISVPERLGIQIVEVILYS